MASNPTSPQAADDGDEARPRRSILRWLLSRVALALLATLLALSAVEVFARVAPYDDRVLAKLSHSMYEGPELYRPSDDPWLLFELRPGAAESRSRMQDGNPGWPLQDRIVDITVNEWGARGTPHQLPKQEGVFRIVFCGPSTVWGAYLDDGETLPAQLERVLAQVQPPGRRVEVWNFGASGQVLGQSARAAIVNVRRTDADLALVMATNVGPRPVLFGDPRTLGDRLEADPWVAVEYFLPPPWLGPPAIGQSADPSRLDPRIPSEHRALFTAVRWSAAIRWAAAVDTARRRAADPSLESFYRSTADLVMARAAIAEADELGVPLVFVSGPGQTLHPLLGRLEPPLHATVGIEHPADPYHQMHPPPWVVRWMAERLAHQLTGAGLVPGAKVPRPDPPVPPEGVFGGIEGPPEY